MWVITAWNWIKENTWAAWTALGAIITATIAIVVATSGDDEVLEETLKKKKESDDDRAKTATEQREIVEQFHRMTEEIKKEAKKKERELSDRQEKDLEEMTEKFKSAKTPEDMKEVVKAVKKAFPELTAVPLDSLVEVHDD